MQFDENNDLISEFFHICPTHLPLEILCRLELVVMSAIHNLVKDRQWHDQRGSMVIKTGPSIYRHGFRFPPVFKSVL